MGTSDPWYQGWDLTDEERDRFRKISAASRKAKASAMNGNGRAPVHEINVPRLRPEALMPLLPPTGLTSLSLFSGGGGLDLGFERAGLGHAASYEIIEAAAATLRAARPEWSVFGGDAGDVRTVDWTRHSDVDLIHGGPPCQPFSSAGRQRGQSDPRDMIPEFVRAVSQIRPAAFVAENVPALLTNKFAVYLKETLLEPLSAHYKVQQVLLKADWFGVPQVRKRVFFVGLRSDLDAANRFVPPVATHDSSRLFNSAARAKSPGTEALDVIGLDRCMGVREALGLPDIGFDALAPTMRSGLTGPRHTTSILSSVSAKRVWDRLQIWPNGVAANREAARAFVPDNGHFRLSVPDCALIQGFPDDWPFEGATYMAIGQIGNAVPPPMGYRIARAVAEALRPSLVQQALEGASAGSP